MAVHSTSWILHIHMHLQVYKLKYCIVVTNKGTYLNQFLASLKAAYTFNTYIVLHVAIKKITSWNFDQHMWSYGFLVHSSNFEEGPSVWVKVWKFKLCLQGFYYTRCLLQSTCVLYIVVATIHHRPCPTGWCTPWNSYAWVCCSCSNSLDKSWFYYTRRITILSVLQVQNN